MEESIVKEVAENKKITREWVKELLPARNPRMHKGDCGRVLIVAGNAGMTGAAVFAATAALRSGSGLVYLCVPKAAYGVVQTLIPEAICVDWDTVVQRLTTRDPSAWGYDAIAFGPGMGTASSTKRMLKSILLSYDGPLILDADGLNVLTAEKDLWRFAQSYQGEIILTPHVGEAKRLLSHHAPETLATRAEMVMCLATEYNSIGILKGSGTLVAQKTGEDVFVYENTTGNPGMATAGSGDVLTGVITSFVGQGMSPWEAARAGVYIHGLAGDLACDKIGEYGMIARDILEQLPFAIKNL